MLTQYQTGQLQQVVDIVVKSALPEKVFLLGVSCTSRHEENIFIQNDFRSPGWQQVTQYCLLILTRKENRHKPGELQDMIESRCFNNATPVVIYMEAIHTFNAWLQSGHPFACCVARQGIILYDAGKTPLTTPGTDKTTGLFNDFTRCNTHVSEFLAGAELYRLRKQFSLAAFLVHQAAEQAFTFVIRLITGYRVVTHNLEKLFGYARPFLPELELCFNRQNSKEQNLFKLLQRAYIHSRYREDYSISENDLCILIERVKKLQVLAQNIASERMEVCT